MQRYQKLKRRIAKEQESFLEDVVLAAGLKLCTDVSRPPDGRSVYIEQFSDSVRDANFVLIPCFAVPNYMSVDKNSPTYIERRAQEKNTIRDVLFAVLPGEGLQVKAEDAFTDNVKLYVRV